MNPFLNIFLYFCKYIAQIWELSIAYLPILQAHHYQMIRSTLRAVNTSSSIQPSTP